MKREMPQEKIDVPDFFFFLAAGVTGVIGRLPEPDSLLPAGAFFFFAFSAISFSASYEMKNKM